MTNYGRGERRLVAKSQPQTPRLMVTPPPPKPLFSLSYSADFGD